VRRRSGRDSVATPPLSGYLYIIIIILPVHYHHPRFNARFPPEPGSAGSLPPDDKFTSTFYLLYFTNRVVDMGNNLPNDVISAKSLYSFRCRLNKANFSFSVHYNMAFLVINFLCIYICVFWFYVAYVCIASGRLDICFNKIREYTYTTSITRTLKPRPHQQQRRSNILKCYKSNDFFLQSRMLFRCRFWQQYQTKFRPFDKVETNWTCSISSDVV